MFHADVNITELAKGFGVSQPNMSQRIKTGKFTKEELHKIASILDCEYISVFRFKDGNEY